MNVTSLFLKVALLGAEWVLWLLIILSAISFAVVIEKFIFFFRTRISVVEVSSNLQEKLFTRGVGEARKYLEGFGKIPQMKIALSALDEIEGCESSIENAVIATRVVEKAFMEKNLNFLATLGNNAPFIGLFGTVIGIIRAFHDLSLNVSGGTSIVMAGISEALVATAAGLFVAIPAVVFNNVFRQWTKRVLNDATVLVSVIVNYRGTEKNNEVDGHRS